MHFNRFMIPCWTTREKSRKDPWATEDTLKPGEQIAEYFGVNNQLHSSCHYLQQFHKLCLSTFLVKPTNIAEAQECKSKTQKERKVDGAVSWSLFHINPCKNKNINLKQVSEHGHCHRWSEHWVLLLLQTAAQTQLHDNKLKTTWISIAFHQHKSWCVLTIPWCILSLSKIANLEGCYI